MSDDLRSRVLADPTIPAPVRTALEKGFTLEDIRLDAHGRWTHQGLPIEHERVRTLFSRSIDRTDGGTYVLRIGRYTYPITVEDVPLFVASVRRDAAKGVLSLVFDGGESEDLDDTTHLDLSGDGRLVVEVREGRMRARFRRAPYHDVLDWVEEADEGYVIPVGRARFRLTSQSE